MHWIATITHPHREGLELGTLQARNLEDMAQQITHLLAQNKVQQTIHKDNLVQMNTRNCQTAKKVIQMKAFIKLEKFYLNKEGTPYEFLLRSTNYDSKTKTLRVNCVVEGYKKTYSIRIDTGATAEASGEDESTSEPEEENKV